MGTREAIRGHRYGFVAVFAAVALTLIVTAAVGVGFVLNADGGGVSAQTDAGEAFTGTTDLADAETTFRGNDSGDKAGYEVASAGDVNGDGVRDVLVGAPYADTGDDADENAGAVYLFYGPVDAGDVNVSEADVTFHGAPGDVAGWSIAAGNLDGDNYSDVVVGAPYSDGAADDPANDSGVVYVAEGGEDLPEQVNLSTDADATYRGVEAGDEAGYSVATVDGAGVESDAGETADGETDDGNATDALLVGAPYANTTDVDAGAAYLVENVTDGEHALDAAANVTYAGATARDQAGWSVADAGDVNDDGAREVVVAAPFNHTGNASYAGDVSILSTDYGDGETVQITRGHTYHGVGEDDRAGWSVSTAGDVNDDGFADVVVGAPYNDSAGNRSGVAYLLHGGEDLPENESLDDAAVVLRGEDAGDRAGWAVSDAGSGDVDCNGYDDVLVGAPYRNSTAVHAGTAYVVHGGEGTGVVSLGDAGAELRGEGAGDRAGWSVAAANDSTGDDAKDVLVGATHNDTNDANAGAAYLVAGDCPVKPTEEDIDRPMEPPRDDEPPTRTPDETQTETPTPEETPTETPEPTPEPPQPNASLSIDCVDEQTVVNVSATDLGDRNVTVAFNSTNDTADFNRTFQPDANGTLDERINVSDESNATVTVHLGDNVSGDDFAEANVTAGECDAPGPEDPRAVEVATGCIDDQGEIAVTNPNNDTTVYVEVTGDDNNFSDNATLAPGENSIFDDLEDGNYTVSTYVDDADGEPVDQQSVEVDCPEEEPVEEPEAATVAVNDCVDEQGGLSIGNPNNETALYVEIIDENDTVVANDTLQAGENTSFDDLEDGNYTVTSYVGDADGESVDQQTVEIDCDEEAPVEEPAAVTVDVEECVDEQGSLAVENSNNETALYVEITDENDTVVANDSLQAGENATFDDLGDGNYTVNTYLDDDQGELLNEQSVTIDCDEEGPAEEPEAPTVAVDECVDEQGGLSIENPNNETALYVEITDDDDDSVVTTETLQAGDNVSVGDMDDGNYTVTSYVGDDEDDQVSQQTVEIDCDEEGSGPAPDITKFNCFDIRIDGIQPGDTVELGWVNPGDGETTSGIETITIDGSGTPTGDSIGSATFEDGTFEYDVTGGAQADQHLTNATVIRDGSVIFGPMENRANCGEASAGASQSDAGESSPNPSEGTAVTGPTDDDNVTDAETEGGESVDNESNDSDAADEIEPDAEPSNEEDATNDNENQSGENETNSAASGESSTEGEPTTDDDSEGEESEAEESEAEESEAEESEADESEAGDSEDTEQTNGETNPDEDGSNGDDEADPSDSSADADSA